MFSAREYVEAGGLMSYGESFRDFYRRSATFVDKLIKGAKAADLPIEQPSRFYSRLISNRQNDRRRSANQPDCRAERDHRMSFCSRHKSANRSITGIHISMPPKPVAD